MHPFIPALLIPAAFAGARALDAQARPRAGTYALALCRTAPCAPGDTTAAYLTATVVLLDSADAARTGLPRARWDREPANGCFRVRHRRRLADSYAGIAAAGELRWRLDPDAPSGVTFALYRSPDAGYAVRLVPGSGGLLGSGASWGAGAAAITAPRDTVVAVRLGSADVGRCR